MSFETILGIAVTTIIAAIGFLTKAWFSKIISQVDKISATLNEIKVLLKGNEKDIEYLKLRQEEMIKTLYTHDTRISNIEKNKE